MTPTLAPPPADAPPPSYFIRAAQLMPRNAFQNPLYPILGDLVPFGSSRDPLNSAAYVVNHRLNLDHPYSGLSVDVLEPTYDTTSSLMFDITPSDGPCLTRGNSSTAQGIAAAASRRNPSSSHHSAPFLRLALDPVTHRVERNSAATHPDGPASTTHEDLNREALFALFSGRLPRRQWPTLALVGLEEVNTADVPSLRAGRTDPARNVLRVAPGAAGGGGGAFRGLVEALTQRDGERPLAQVVQPGAGAAALDDEAFVTGFRLRAKRTWRVPPSTSAGAQRGDERGETSASAGTGERWAAPGSATRRRGVGGNGGPAVLWQGREEDPDEEPQVTILRAGDEGEGVRRGLFAPLRRRARQLTDALECSRRALCFGCRGLRPSVERGADRWVETCPCSTAPLLKTTTPSRTRTKSTRSPRPSTRRTRPSSPSRRPLARSAGPTRARSTNTATCTPRRSRACGSAPTAATGSNSSICRLGLSRCRPRTRTVRRARKGTTAATARGWTGACSTVV